MIDVRNLTFAYSGHPSIFDGFSLKVGRGESWAIIGPSGCGKTTLLYLLAGLLRPTAGTIVIAGNPITRPRPRTGLVLQDHGLLPWATVRENAKLGFRIREFYGPDGKHAPRDTRTTRAAPEQQVDYWLKRLGIDSLGDKYPSQLSRGQRQRTAIARTLALEPDLLLMDEPFSALDAAIREDLQNVMTEFHRESDITSVLVTHDIEEAVFVGERILVLSGRFEHHPRVIQNEIAARVPSRDEATFRDLCDELRGLVGRLK
jgi:NitT/TauT family transport system ATP-binding protein